MCAGATEVASGGASSSSNAAAAAAAVLSPAQRAQLVGAWQAALPHIAPELAEDNVLDVIAARRTRIVLLTNRHISYLIAKQHHVRVSRAPCDVSLRVRPYWARPLPQSKKGSDHRAHRRPPQGSEPVVTYRLKWFIRNDLVDNIRGVERTYRVSIEFRKHIRLGGLVLKLPLRAGMRTDDAESHQNLIYRLNRHIGKRQASYLQGGGSAAGGGRGGGGEVDDLGLTIAVPPATPPVPLPQHAAAPAQHRQHH